MFKRLLLPVDLSDDHAAMLRVAADLADRDAATVTLLHVIEPLRGISFDELRSFYDDLRARAERALATWADKLSREHLDVEHEIVFGKRGEAIVRHAMEKSIDVIVMRSHVLDREHPAQTFGTISHQVAILAPCSVFLVRQPHAT